MSIPKRNKGEKSKKKDEEESEPFLGWQIVSQTTVVLFGLVAVVLSLGLILNAYEVDEASVPAPTTTTAAQVTTSTQVIAQAGESEGATGETGPTGPGEGSSSEEVPPPEPSTPQATSVSSSSVVAILTPIMAGIVGIAGLFFGVSGTGSARGREAATEPFSHETVAQLINIAAKGQPAGSPPAGGGGEQEVQSPPEKGGTGQSQADDAV